MNPENIQTKKLDRALIAILTEQFYQHSELTLINSLKAEPYGLFTGMSLMDTEQMFIVHFTLYNALYRLREKWLAEEYAVMDIALSRISLAPYHSVDSSQIQIFDHVAAYYLDWRNLTSTTVEDVEQMLDSFWQSLASYLIEPEEKLKACQILGVEQGTSATDVKKQYKKLCTIYHPDKKGNAEMFQQVQWAWQILR